MLRFHGCQDLLSTGETLLSAEGLNAQYCCIVVVDERHVETGPQGKVSRQWNGVQYKMMIFDTNEPTHLHNVVVKQQPEAVALHDGDVVASVWAAGERVVCQTSGDPSAHAH